MARSEPDIDIQQQNRALHGVISGLRIEIESLKEDMRRLNKMVFGPGPEDFGKAHDGDDG